LQGFTYSLQGFTYSLQGFTYSLQGFTYSYRVWITLIKLLYAPLRHRRAGPS